MKYDKKEKHRDEESTCTTVITENSRRLRGMWQGEWKMASERRTEPEG